jgi:hypothetical protein
MIPKTWSGAVLAVADKETIELSYAAINFLNQHKAEGRMSERADGFFVGYNIEGEKTMVAPREIAEELSEGGLVRVRHDLAPTMRGRICEVTERGKTALLSWEKLCNQAG